MNLIEQMEILKGLSDQQLAAEMQSPTGGAAPFMVATEISRRRDMRQRYMNEAARQRPQTTVIEDIAMSMPQMGMMPPQPGMGGGIAAAAPQNAPAVQAFAEGGLVDYDYNALARRYQDRLDATPAARDRAAALALIAAGAGIMGGGHSNTLQNVGIGAAAGLNAYQKALSDVDSEEEAALRGLTDLGELQHRRALADAAEERARREFEAEQARGFNTDETMFQPIAGVINGQAAYIQAGNKGSVRQLEVPEGFAPRSRYEKIDLGDRYKIIDTTTNETWYEPKQGAPSQNMNVTVGPDGRTMTPAPGSPEAVKQAAEADAGFKAASNAMSGFERQSQTVMDMIQTAKDQAGFWTTGLLGQVANNFGGTPAADLFETLQAIKSNIGFDKLQAMREASPTGGALGPVSDTENKLLQAVNGSLEQRQSKPQLVKNLDRILELYEQLLVEKREAFQKDFGNAAGNGSTIVTPEQVNSEIDDLVKLYSTP